MDEEYYGRLHIIGKTRKLSFCRLCKEEIPIASKCYNQAFHSSDFPKPTRVCFICGENLLNNGEAELAEKVKKSTLLNLKLSKEEPNNINKIDTLSEEYNK